MDLGCGTGTLTIMVKEYQPEARLDGLKSTEANAKGLLPRLVFEAGFENVLLEKRIRTLYGEVQIINARKI